MTYASVVEPLTACSTADVVAAGLGDDGPSQADAPAAHLRTGSLRDVRVLLVEDDGDALELLTLALEGRGAKVTACSDARAALALPGSFDVIVSDIGMPEMDGYTFMRRVRSRDAHADIPSLALTAYARPEDRERALRAGYQEHLTKPIDIPKLVAAISRWARRRQPT